MVTYLFPSDPLGGRSLAVDSHFEREYIVASALAPVALIDSYSLGDPKPRLQIPADAESPFVYRGWMLSAEEYGQLEAAVEARGHRLLTATAGYLQAHSMENWLPGFEQLTPPTVILDSAVSEDELLAAAATLPSEHGFFLKGSVKSEPGFSRAERADELPGLLERFLDFADLAPGQSIALRSFTPLDGAVAELRSWWIGGLLVDFRVHPNFFGKGLEDPLAPATQGDHFSSAVDFLAGLTVAVRSLESDFITADIALTATGDWELMEIGAGEVSGVAQGQSSEELEAFYGDLTRGFDGLNSDLLWR